MVDIGWGLAGPCLGCFVLICRMVLTCKFWGNYLSTSLNFWIKHFGIHGKNCRNPPFFWGQKPMVSSEKNFPKPIHWSTKLATLWADGGNPLEDSYLATDLTWVHLQGELTISRNTNIWMVWLPDTNNAMKMLVNLPNLGDCVCWNAGKYPRMNNMYVICIQCIYVTCPSCDTHVEWSNTSHLPLGCASHSHGIYCVMINYVQATYEFLNVISHIIFGCASHLATGF